MSNYQLLRTTFLLILSFISYSCTVIDSNISLTENLNKYDVTIYRDSWGVPHIYGKTDMDAAYGLAYANAEDDLQNMQEALLAARGKLASVFGKDHAPNDYMVHLLEIWDKVDKQYDSSLSKKTQKLCEAYADGVNKYILDHPNEALPSVYPVSGKDIVAGFVHKTPLFFSVHKHLENMMTKKSDEFQSSFDLKDMFETIQETQYTKGSNVFAVSSKRSDDNRVRLAINSHQPWDGQYAWYEAHVNSEEGWNMVGGLFPGSPIVLVGHNDNLGWGHTVNAPDLVDVYELEVHPDDPYLYKLDGEWKPFKVKKVPIKVKFWGPISWTFKREALWSDHGPVLRGEYATYAIRYANYDDIRMVEQWYKMNKASNLKEWRSAMSMMSIPMFNAGYADKEGNIYFIYNASLPLRKDGYDWKGVLPGDSSDLIWTEYLSFEELPQVLNPTSGFIQNCNNTPFITTTGDDNPSEELYDLNLGIETRMSNRALRAMELFGTDPSISAEEFEAYKYDMQYSEDSYMLTYVNRLIELSDQFDDIELQTGVDILKSWDRNTNIENKHTSLPIISFGWFLETAPHEISDENLIDGFKYAVRYLYEHYGKLDVVWGNVNRLIRGSFNYAIGGGPDISHAVYGLPSENGQLKGLAGDGYIMLVEWDENGDVNSRSIHQYGSNTQHPESPHFADQSKLFVKKRLKPVWLKLNEIREHLERKYSLNE